jgi:hypothetical protein
MMKKIEDLAPLHGLNNDTLLAMLEHAAYEGATEALKRHAEANLTNSVVDDDPLLNTKDAARFLSISTQTLYKWRKEGIVITTMVGGISPRFKLSNLMATIEADNVTT